MSKVVEMPQWEPYRPSNGSEGASFIESWCGTCKRDKAFRDGGWQDASLGCPIVAASFVYEIDHPKYPKEWRMQWRKADDDYSYCKAECTAHEPDGEPHAAQGSGQESK